jgi:hypothetical protein
MKRTALCLMLAAGLVSSGRLAQAAPSATPSEARTIAQEAYIYGYPLVENYKTLYAQAVEQGGPNFKAPFNQIGNTAAVFTPKDTAIITPNSDTPYSFVWMDLRAEPVVLTLPAVDAKRYYSAQLIDLYTHNFAYLGSRATGSKGGSFLIAGPGWKGQKPANVASVIRCETNIAYALYRTQLFDDKDLAEVKAIQAGYKVQTLRAFLGQSPAPAAPAVAWPKPEPEMTETPALFRYLSFLLAFAPTDPSEKAVMARFAKLGIGAGLAFDERTLAPDMRAALEAGIADGKAQFAAFKAAKIDALQVTSGDFFGTRAHLKNNYMYRYAGAVLGIYGNSIEEADYTAYFVDAKARPLNAADNKYTLRFEKDKLPPANAFWSITMYDGRSKLLVANPLHRYLINSTMLNGLKRDAAGGITLYIQKDSPGQDDEANWLPAPNGPFYAVMRLYLPKPAALNGQWKRPPLVKVEVPTPEEVRAIAKDAYVYGVPMVDTYKTLYPFNLDKANPQYKGPFNALSNIARVFTPEDTAFVTPNSDTPYSFAMLDLRAEPMVISVPKLEKNRYFVFQLMDLYTFNYAYIGSRTTGNEGGNFLISGPGWKGEVPKGIAKTFPAETQLVSVVGRTQLFDPADLENVKKIQAGYKVQSLSAFQGKAAPAAPPEIAWIKPTPPGRDAVTPEFFNQLAFLLQFAQPPHPSELALRARFAKIGIVPGKPFDTKSLAPDVKTALEAGIADGQRAIDDRRTAMGGKSDLLFGTRAFLKNDYVARATGTQIGIGANSRDEAIYPFYTKDSEGQSLDAAKNKYRLRIAKGQLPPVNAFWSLTMYDLPKQLLVKNPLNRYLINSPMLPKLKADADGALTIYIQATSPGADKESNWLPAPSGPFMMAMRCYWPKRALLDGTWKTPELTRVP